MHLISIFYFKKYRTKRFCFHLPNKK